MYSGTYRTLILAIAGALLMSLQSLAQSEEQGESKAERLREILSEKMHIPNTEAGKKELQGQMKTTGSDKRITTTTTGVQESEMFIVVNPVDSNKLLISYIEQGTGGIQCPIYYSSNGGQTWFKSLFSCKAITQADFPGQQIVGGGDPAFGWDKNGRVYFTWIYLTLNASQDTMHFTLNWAYSDDNGHLWSVKPGTQHIVGSGVLENTGSGQNILNIGDGVTDREWLTVDNSGGPNQGQVYCSFVCFPAGTAPTFEAIKALAPGADSFGTMLPIAYGSTQFGNVEVDKNGVLHASFANVGLQQINHASSANGGLTFSTSHLVRSCSLLFPQSNFKIHERENSAPNLAIDSMGNLHLVYTDFQSGTTKAYYSRSTNGGVSWTTKLLDSLVGNQHTFMPSVTAFANTVTISLTAYTSNNSTNYYQLYSLNFGQTFGVPVVLSSSITDYSYYLSGNYFFGDYSKSTSLACQVFASWSDGRNQLGPKVYFAKSNPCIPTAVPEVSSVNGSIKLEAVYPNPAKDLLNLKIFASTTEQVILQLVDISGKTIISKSYSVHQGTQEVSASLSGVVPGHYILYVNNASGIIASRNIVVQ